MHLQYSMHALQRGKGSPLASTDLPILGCVVLTVQQSLALVDRLVPVVVCVLLSKVLVSATQNCILSKLLSGVVYSALS